MIFQFYDFNDVGSLLPVTIPQVDSLGIIGRTDGGTDLLTSM